MDDNFSAQLLFYFQNKKAFEYELNMAHIYLCNNQYNGNITNMLISTDDKTNHLRRFILHY